MAASPRWKVFNPSGEYVASCKHVEDAAMVVSGYGHGATIRDGHTTIVWKEGNETQEAGESFDFVLTTVSTRVRARLELRVKAMTERQQSSAKS